MREVVAAPGTEAAELLRLAGALETKSTHPIAKAVVQHAAAAAQGVPVESVEEIAVTACAAAWPAATCWPETPSCCASST